MQTSLGQVVYNSKCYTGRLKGLGPSIGCLEAPGTSGRDRGARYLKQRDGRFS